MDTLIRAAQLSSVPRRLSEAPRATSADSGAHPARPSPAQSLRDEIESQLRAELAAEALEQYESARAQGLADGRAAGLADTAEELRTSVEAMTRRAEEAMASLAQAQQIVLDELESSVGEVAFAAVCRLAGESASSKAFVMGMVEQTCAELRGDLAATVRLHPRDVETLQGLLRNTELRIGTLGLKVIADDSLQLGGCRVEAASGEYDGGLENQLRRLYTILTAADTRPAVKD